MKKFKKEQSQQLVSLLLLLLLVSILLGYSTRIRFPDLFSQKPRSPASITTVQPSDVDWNKVEKIKAYVDDSYNGPIVDETLLEGALKGMVNSLEGGGQFFNAREYSEITNRPKMTRGTGIHFGVKDNRLVVLRVDDNSQAYKTGILPGDEILKINGRVYTGRDIETARSLMVSDARTTVDLHVMRERDQMLIKVKLRLLTQQMIRARLYQGIGIIRIPGFKDGVAESFGEILDGLIEEGAESLILDLRDLPSGRITEAVQIASRFIAKDDPVVAIRDTKGNIREFPSRDGSYDEMPLIVLVNDRTEGTGEFVAGALSQRADAEIIGEKTMGEGRIYSYIDLPQGEGIRLVTGYFLLPDRSEIHQRGINPTLTVPGNLRYSTNLIQVNDLQMQKAIEKAMEAKEK